MCLDKTRQRQFETKTTSHQNDRLNTNQTVDTDRQHHQIHAVPAQHPTQTNDEIQMHPILSSIANHNKPVNHTNPHHQPNQVHQKPQIQFLEEQIKTDPLSQLLQTVHRKTPKTKEIRPKIPQTKGRKTGQKPRKRACAEQPINQVKKEQ